MYDIFTCKYNFAIHLNDSMADDIKLVDVSRGGKKNRIKEQTNISTLSPLR